LLGAELAVEPLAVGPLHVPYQIALVEEALLAQSAAEQLFGVGPKVLSQRTEVRESRPAVLAFERLILSMLPAAMDAEGQSLGENGSARVTRVLPVLEHALHLGNVVPAVCSPVVEVASNMSVHIPVMFEGSATDLARFVSLSLRSPHSSGSSSRAFGLFVALETHLLASMVDKPRLGVEAFPAVLAPENASAVSPHHMAMHLVFSGVALPTEVALVLGNLVLLVNGFRVSFHVDLELRRQPEAMMADIAAKLLAAVHAVSCATPLAEELLAAQRALEKRQGGDAASL